MPRIVTSHQGQHDEFLFLFRDDDDDGVVESRAMIGSLHGGETDGGKTAHGLTSKATTSSTQHNNSHNGGASSE